MNFGQPSISLAVTVPSRPAGRMSFVRNEDGSVEMTELAPDSAED